MYYVICVCMSVKSTLLLKFYQDISWGQHLWMWCGRKTTLSPAEFHITAPTLQRCWIWPYNFKWCHSKKKNTHTHTRISIVHTALLRLCILPLLIEYDLQPPMLLTATWGKVKKKKKKKKKKKHIREMNTEQFSDITRKKPQYEFCKQNRNQLGKKRERKRKMTLL